MEGVRLRSSDGQIKGQLADSDLIHMTLCDIGGRNE
jgi:hypothetical protein